MTIKDLRIASRMTQHEFADFLGIPFRTIQNWEGGQRTPADYIIRLIKYKLEKEGIV